MRQMLTGLLRHVLTTAGGVLVANGWIAESDLATTAAGVAAIIVGAAWSLLNKRKAAAT